MAPRSIPRCRTGLSSAMPPPESQRTGEIHGHESGHPPPEVRTRTVADRRAGPDRATAAGAAGAAAGARGQPDHGGQGQSRQGAVLGRATVVVAYRGVRHVPSLRGRRFGPACRQGGAFRHASRTGRCAWHRGRRHGFARSDARQRRRLVRPGPHVWHGRSGHRPVHAVAHQLSLRAQLVLGWPRAHGVPGPRHQRHRAACECRAREPGCGPARVEHRDGPPGSGLDRRRHAHHGRHTAGARRVHPGRLEDVDPRPQLSAVVPGGIREYRRDAGAHRHGDRHLRAHAGLEPGAHRFGDRGLGRAHAAAAAGAGHLRRLGLRWLPRGLAVLRQQFPLHRRASHRRRRRALRGHRQPGRPGGHEDPVVAQRRAAHFLLPCG